MSLAHLKVAYGLVNIKAIRIEGVAVGFRKVRDMISEKFKALVV